MNIETAPVSPWRRESFGSEVFLMIKVTGVTDVVLQFAMYATLIYMPPTP